MFYSPPNQGKCVPRAAKNPYLLYACMRAYALARELSKEEGKISKRRKRKKRKEKREKRKEERRRTFLLL